MTEHGGKKFLRHLKRLYSSKYIKLPIKTKKLAKQYLFHAFCDVIGLFKIIKFLKDELNNKIEEQDQIMMKCQYHIENFYQKYYLFEENIFNLLDNIFMLRSNTTTYDTIKNNAYDKKLQIKKLLKMNYNEISQVMDRFFADKEIKFARNKRRFIVHRPVNNIIGTWLTFKLSSDHDFFNKDGENIGFKKFFLCLNITAARNELEVMGRIHKKSVKFFVELVLIIDKYVY